jgi:hypothetical protein
MEPIVNLTAYQLLTCRWHLANQTRAMARHSVRDGNHFLNQAAASRDKI